MSRNKFIIGEGNSYNTGSTYQVIMCSGKTISNEDYYLYTDSEYVYTNTNTNTLAIRSGATIDYYLKCVDLSGNTIWAPVNTGTTYWKQIDNDLSPILNATNVAIGADDATNYKLYVKGNTYMDNNDAYSALSVVHTNGLADAIYVKDDSVASRAIKADNQLGTVYEAIMGPSGTGYYTTISTSGQTGLRVLSSSKDAVGLNVDGRIKMYDLPTGTTIGNEWFVVKTGAGYLETRQVSGGTGSTGTSGTSGSSGTSGGGGSSISGFEIADAGGNFTINSGVCNGQNFLGFDSSLNNYREYWFDGSNWNSYNTLSTYNSQYFQDTTGLGISSNAGTISWLYLNVSGDCRSVCQIGDTTLKQALEGRPLENIYDVKVYGEPSWTTDGSFILVGRIICNYNVFLQVDNITTEPISYNTHKLILDHNLDIDNKQGVGPDFLHLKQSEYESIPASIYGLNNQYALWKDNATGTTYGKGLSIGLLQDNGTYVLSTAGIWAQYLDSFKYSTTMTNKLLSVDTKQVAQSPIGSYLWHNYIAFNKVATPVEEYTTNTGSTWSSRTLKGELFAGLENQSVEVISAAQNGVRWTWTGGFQYSLCEWVELGFAYGTGTEKVRITVEAPTGTAIFTYTGYTIAQGGPVFCKIPTMQAPTQTSCRITILCTGTTTPVYMSNIKVLTSRQGDQGRGKEDEYPYLWDKSQNMVIGGTAVDASAKLWVPGTFRLTSAGYGAGKCLVSDANGYISHSSTSPALGSGTATYVPLWTASSVLGNSVISQDTSTKRININNTNSTGITYNGALSIQSEGSMTPLYVYGFGTNNVTSNQIQVRVARGSYTGQTAMLANDIILGLGGSGHDGSTLRGGSAASVNMNAAVNWNSGNTGSYMKFLTTQIGTTTNAEKMRLTDSGQLFINTTNTGYTEKLVVSGSTRFGTATGYTLISDDGTVRLYDEATAWDDLIVSLSNIKAPASDPPSWVSYKNCEVPAFTKNGTNVLYFTTQMPHRWKEGSNIEFHMHCSYPDSNAGNSVWTFTYSWSNINDVFPTASGITKTFAAPALTDKHTLHDFGYINASGKTLSSVLLCSLSRIGGDGSDDYDNSIYALSADFHYMIDSFGSSSELLK